MYRLLSTLAILAYLMPDMCRIGPCWDHATVYVDLGEEVAFEEGQTLMIVEVGELTEDDVLGFDEDGIPITSLPHVPAEEIGLETGQYEYTWDTEDRVIPFTVYYYAFIDENGDGNLGPGEVFGVSPDNPGVQDCHRLYIDILVDQVRE